MIHRYEVRFTIEIENDRPEENEVEEVVENVLDDAIAANDREIPIHDVLNVRATYLGENAR